MFTQELLVDQLEAVDHFIVLLQHHVQLVDVLVVLVLLQSDVQNGWG